MFQYPDGAWNHGEGFSASSADLDQGGWHGIDLGTGLQSGDVHTYANWQPHTWVGPVHPLNGASMQRFVGYLRPAGLPLPTQHPRYGLLPPGTTYVDQGAFELFRPNQSYAQQKILLCIGHYPTQGFPKQVVPWPADPQSLDLRQTYMGFFSPDGLIRDEQANTQVAFLANTGPPKRAVSEQFVALWSAGGAYQSHQALYYPICGYAVTTVPQRQTELVQQRSLQLVQAVKLLLQESGPRNPIGTPLTAAEVENRLVVVWAGGSNGGLQSSFAAMLYPDLVHGCFSQTYSPSTERLIGEQEFGYAVAALTGSSSIGADFAGCYNAIVAVDLDGNQQKELYVGGSAGIWRFDLSGGAP